MEKKIKKWMETKELERAIKQMRKEKLGDARVELYFENGEARYGIVKISHFHAIPNLVLTIKKIDDNYAK